MNFPKFTPFWVQIMKNVLMLGSSLLKGI
nr:unnamed protein product [Callosobruchus chinensis]